MQEINFQELAKQVPRYYTMHEVYQSVWYGGREIIKGSRDNMFPRMKKIKKEDIKDKVVVDIGCNLGASSFWAIENGAKECVGLDVARDGIDLANTIAKELNVNCRFEVQDFGVPLEKKGDVAFCFACHDDISKDGKRDQQLLNNLKKYDIIYFETHLKNSLDGFEKPFLNWDVPQIIKDNFNLEYLGETGEGNLKRDFYKLT
jgi:SAM-dependent methyltransferase